jgi:hypothetical protein
VPPTTVLAEIAVTNWIFLHMLMIPIPFPLGLRHIRSKGPQHLSKLCCS